MQYISKYIHAIYKCLLALLIKNPRIKKWAIVWRKKLYVLRLIPWRPKSGLTINDNLLVVLEYTVDQKDLFPLG